MSHVDAEALRRQFPALNQDVHGQPLVYLDNAATSLKPQCVIDSVVGTLSKDSANIHRGVHLLSQRATEKYEGARDIVRQFIGARDRAEIVFVRGATEAINLVARSWGEVNLRQGDEVVISDLEHHANIVPWQMLRDRTGAVLKVAKMDDNGELQPAGLGAVLSDRTRLVALTQVSNALGTVLPIDALVRQAQNVGARVLVDGAQAVAHMPINVQALGADFYVFSGHKLYGPDGIGILYGRHEVLESMVPYQTGGDMIRQVTLERTTFNDLPHRFEAGTPSISGAIGLGAAIQFVTSVGFDWIERHEQDLLTTGTKWLEEVPGVSLVGRPQRRSGVISFILEGVHPHDVGTILDTFGVAIRTGHHCAQPVMDRFGIPATSRASLGLFNTEHDLRRLVDGIIRIKEMFA